VFNLLGISQSKKSTELKQFQFVTDIGVTKFDFQSRGASAMKRNGPWALVAVLVAVLAFGEAYSAEPAALLIPGKTRSGTIVQVKEERKGLPPTQDVTLRVEKVMGDSAEIYVTWSRTSENLGKAGAGTFTAPIKRVGETIEINGQIGRTIWRFIFAPDGTVNCTMFVSSKLVKRWGDLK
jgi:hypothetical protein